VALKLGAAVTQARVRLWSPAMALVLTAVSGPLAPGWASVTLPQDQMARLAPGLYFYTVEAWGERAEALGAAKGRLWVSR
jgi:hypothetical protein